MRLLKQKRRLYGSSFEVIERFDNEIPPYAILSHTWGSDSEEVTFRDIMKSSRKAKSKAGYKKLRFTADQAAKDGLEYFWVDTCCIDKSSSTELTEAINSMFKWYQKAAKCYVYLTDVLSPSPSHSTQFINSRWFTRGWTLQELLAPASVDFFAADGQFLGSKSSREYDLSQITGIPTKALGGQSLCDYEVVERMSWAKNRKTKRKEDEAYSLLGIFGIYIPMIYGEGSKAWVRLQEAIDLDSKREAIEQSSKRSAMSLSEDSVSEDIEPDPKPVPKKPGPKPVPKPNQCRHCRQKFPSRTRLYKHLREEPSHMEDAESEDPDPNQCRHCRQKFPSRTRLYKHLREKPSHMEDLNPY